MISYEPLWKTMADRQITTYTLIHQHGVNPRTVHHLKHNHSITLYTLEKLCAILHCTANDVVAFVDHSANPDDPCP